jgi:hypothetical protein
MTPSEIIERVAIYRGISVHNIVGKSRKSEYVNARHGAQYLVMKNCANMNQEAMARPFNRDRTTLLHARDAVNDSLSINDGLFRWVTQIELGKGYGDKVLEKLFAAKVCLDKGYTGEAKKIVNDAIELRQSFLDSLEALKIDQMTHNEMNKA